MLNSMTKTAIKKKLSKVLATLVKREENHTCQLCGREHLSGNNAHASHILPKGEYPAYEFKRWNLKTLCLRCHLGRWHKNPLVVAKEFEKRWPEKYKLALLKARKHENQGLKVPPKDKLLKQLLQLQAKEVVF